MNVLGVCIEGIGLWAPGWPDWPSARAGLRGEAQANAAVVTPSPHLLAAAERRRAPLPVLLACDVAGQACAASTHAADTLASVFASTHGDLVITDYMCSTLATAPRELSPIRFHNSVHNAPAGYWTIAAHCHAASTSISGWYASFAVALLEAAVQALADNRPILLAAYDTPSAGPIVDVSPAACAFGVAMLISPAGDRRATLGLGLHEGRADEGLMMGLPAAFNELAAANPMAAQSLPLLAALAAARPASLKIAAGAHSTLAIEVRA